MATVIVNKEFWDYSFGASQLVVDVLLRNGLDSGSLNAC